MCESINQPKNKCFGMNMILVGKYIFSNYNINNVATDIILYEIHALDFIVYSYSYLARYVLITVSVNM